MSDDEDKGFLSRWSQRKAAARSIEPIEPAADAAEQKAEAAEPLDPESLPAIEDLDEGSDYTAFLRKGVPTAMRKAALRKLWVTEPSVVNYRPLVEYAWHENEPGFGPLLPTDDVEKLLKHIIEGNPYTPPPEPARQSEAETEDTPTLAAPDDQPMAEAVEPQEEPLASELPGPRRHGGALPS